MKFPEFCVTLKVRNNLIVARREAMGLSVPKLAEAVGLSYDTVVKLESLRDSAKRKNGSWRPAAVKLAAFFGLLPEDLFTDETEAIENPVVQREMHAEQVFALSAAGEVHSPEALLLEADKASVVQSVLSTLPERSQRALSMRYGSNMSYDEIGEKLGITGGRVQQLVERSLRTLRSSPSRSKLLREVYRG